MSVLVEDREILRPLLFQDPIRNAVVINRVYHQASFALAFADRTPDPRAVLALRPAGHADSPHQFALHAADPDAASLVLHAVPKGASIFHVADDLAFPPVRKALRVGGWGEAVLFELREADFHDVQAHEVAPLDPRWAGMVSKIWAPDWPAEAYVRSRIEEGPSAAIYEDGTPVAWYLTHFETDEFSMLGFLHVLDAHRRKGYAKSLSCALIKEAFRRGKRPCCHVYTDNGPSIRLMEGLGFRRVCLQTWGDGVVPA